MFLGLSNLLTRLSRPDHDHSSSAAGRSAPACYLYLQTAFNLFWRCGNIRLAPGLPSKGPRILTEGQALLIPITLLRSRYKRHETIFTLEPFPVGFRTGHCHALCRRSSTDGTSSTHRGMSCPALYLQHPLCQSGDAPLNPAQSPQPK